MNFLSTSQPAVDAQDSAAATLKEFKSVEK